MTPGSPAPPPITLASRSVLESATTVTEAFERLTQAHPELQCLVFLGRDGGRQPVTLGDLWRQSRAVQGMLVANGLTPGQIVLLVMPTSLDLLASYFGAILAGGVPGLLAPPSHRLGTSSAYIGYLRTIARNASAHSIVCSPDVRPLLTQAVNDALVLTPEDVRDPSAAPPVCEAEPSTIATVQYSSGTTGSPKGVLVTHHALLANIRATREGFGLDENDVSVNWVPLYHDMGLMYAFLMPVLCGIPTVLFPTMDFMRDPALWLRAIHQWRGTISLAPNMAYALCARRLSDEMLQGLDLRSWRIAFSGSEPVLRSTIDSFAGRFAAYGFRASALTAGWGLAEIVGMATIGTIDAPPRVERIDRSILANEALARCTQSDGMDCVSVGTAIRGVDIEIRDANGTVLPDRHVGTVWLQSPFLFIRYHKEPGRTATALVDGWLDTGDRGYLSDGELFFVARNRDLVVIGGEKYAPHDIESIINDVSGVREGCSAVFGVLDSSRGTEVIAAVVETYLTDALERSSLARDIRARVTQASGLAIHHLLLVPPGGVEKTTGGKISRSGTERRWRTQIREESQLS